MSIRTLYINEGEPFAFTERIKKRDGADVVLADVQSISLQVFDGDTELLRVDDIQPEASVYDTLQLDGEWTRDAEGYNFRHAFRHYVTAQTFTKGGKAYRLEFRIEYRDEALGFKLIPGRVVTKGFRRTD